MSSIAFEAEVDGVLQRVTVERKVGELLVTLDGQSVAADVCELLPGVLSLLIGNRSYRCVRSIRGDDSVVLTGGRQHRVSLIDPRSLGAQRRRSGGADGAIQIKASMPGRVVRVLVAAGDAVAAQQGVVVIEAMKMQNELKASRDGRIAELRVAAGDRVSTGQVLAVIE